MKYVYEKMWYIYTHIHSFMNTYIQSSDRQDVFSRMLKIAIDTSKLDFSLISMNK